jgi:asparagine N-glycosylation enzyme membrane subunit Stt3
MNTSSIYVAISIVVLAVVAVLVFLTGKNKRQNRLTPLAGLAFGFILAGILFGESRVVGYSLLGIGVLLSVVDILNRGRSKTS